jgi:hypothetical protein
VILAWAQRKKEDVEHECGRNQLEDSEEVLGKILQDVQNGAKAAFTTQSIWPVYTVPNSIEGSITNAIELEYDRLCRHPKSHIDGDGRMVWCCVRKHLVKDLIEALPKLPPVRK